MAAAVRDELKAARKALEKKSTFVDGMGQILKVIKGDDLAGCEAEALDAVKRCKTVLMSRYDDASLWTECIALVKAARPRLVGKEAALDEWVGQLEKSAPGREEVKPEPPPRPPPRPPLLPTGVSEELRSLLPPDVTELLEHIPTEELQRFFNSVQHNPASLKTLRELTLFTIPHNADPGEFKCVICLEDLPPRSKAKCMPCKHLFHEACLLEWLLKNNTCPVCRYVHHTDKPSDKPQPAAPGPSSYMS
eukprot:TRINITY_DN14981_c0_g1_i1.p1 TRINITY_DN14981_c0_g1~~TRINITY_DN14981_c0_g1_i1.p1  ORF type:complete len:249 (+),score=67.24 TRINITY_DN14981_c0_g1_i1:181-927(+)